MKQKIRKRKLNKKRIFLVLILISIAIFINGNFKNSKIHNKLTNFADKVSYSSEYKTIKEDTNPKYTGIGQEKTKNNDGYFTVFKTENKKKYIEYKQNGDSSWADKEYWGGTMADNGCGITALSIILSGYNKQYSPEYLRKKYYPHLNYDNLSKELSSVYGIKNSDFYYDSEHLSSSKIEEHLSSNRPILICVWNKPSKNRWTTSSHYMVLLATDNNGKVYVSNPNGLENNSKSSGWYDINEVTPYIAKAIYITSY